MDLAGAKIGWIGAGKMGAPMSRRLLAGGASLSVFDAVAENCADVVGAGARAADSCADAAAPADVVVSMIPGDGALRAIALGEEGVLAAMTPGSVYVDMSTVSPASSEEVAEAASLRGVDYLRAPVSGSTLLAEAGGLTIMVSGPQAAYTRCEPVFRAMGDTLHYLGGQEQARYLKLVINTLASATSAVLAEAVTLGRKGGLDWGQMLDIIGDSVAASPLLGYKLGPLKARDFTPTFTVSQMVESMTLVVEAGEGVGVSMPAADLTRRIFEEMMAHGRGDQDFFAAVAHVERKAGLGEPD